MASRLLRDAAEHKTQGLSNETEMQYKLSFVLENTTSSGLTVAPFGSWKSPIDSDLPALIEFPSRRGNVYGWYYAPLNNAFAAPPEDLPPLIVHSHGGPTAAASSTLDLRTQYWTSRGYAVLDVDYSGSSGYGREYRN